MSHIVNKRPFRSCVSQSWLAHAGPDAVLVRDDPNNWTIFQLDIKDEHIHPEDDGYLGDSVSDGDCDE